MRNFHLLDHLCQIMNQIHSSALKNIEQSLAMICRFNAEIS
jgi:hypothetical protein